MRHEGEARRGDAQRSHGFWGAFMEVCVSEEVGKRVGERERVNE